MKVETVNGTVWVSETRDYEIKYYGKVNYKGDEKILGQYVGYTSFDDAVEFAVERAKGMAEFVEIGVAVREYSVRDDRPVPGGAFKYVTVIPEI